MLKLRLLLNRPYFRPASTKSALVLLRSTFYFSRVTEEGNKRYIRLHVIEDITTNKGTSPGQDWFLVKLSFPVDDELERVDKKYMFKPLPHAFIQSARDNSLSAVPDSSITLQVADFLPDMVRFLFRFVFLVNTDYLFLRCFDSSFKKHSKLTFLKKTCVRMDFQVFPINTRDNLWSALTASNITTAIKRRAVILDFIKDASTINLADAEDEGGVPMYIQHMDSSELVRGVLSPPPPPLGFPCKCARSPIESKEGGPGLGDCTTTHWDAARRAY